MRTQNTTTVQRGQVTVEFVFLSLALILFMLIAFQMTWVAVQKWYFNFTAAYTARAWSVQPNEDYSPQSALLTVQASALARNPRLATMPIVRKINAVGMENGIPDLTNRFDGAQLPGIWFIGQAEMLGYFKPDTLKSARFEAGNDGTIGFETYIPIQHEELPAWGGPERPARYDNDRQ
jgi:Flp pilus assembly protein TadG